MIKREKGKFVKTHGMEGTRTYSCWNSMLQRCLNKNNKQYKDYGGRGIIIFKDWLKFENFYKDMGEMPENKSLDRIKNNKGYCKNNCKWSTRREQANNTRRNCFLTYKGKIQTVAQWARETGINYQTLHFRIKSDWSIERALTKH